MFLVWEWVKTSFQQGQDSMHKCETLRISYQQPQGQKYILARDRCKSVQLQVAQAGLELCGREIALYIHSCPASGCNETLDYVMVLRVAHQPIQALTQLVENGGSLSEGVTYFVHHQPYSPTQSLITDRHKPSNIVDMLSSWCDGFHNRL